VKQPLLLITEIDDGTIYFESGKFECETPGEKLPDHVGKAFKALTEKFQHKSDLYPQGNPELAVKYLHRLHRRIPGIFQTNRQGEYRFSPHILLAKVINA
jgi:hypothetical protein